MARKKTAAQAEMTNAEMFPVSDEDRRKLSEELVEAEVELQDLLDEKRAKMARLNEAIKGTRDTISKLTKTLARRP